VLSYEYDSKKSSLELVLPNDSGKVCIDYFKVAQNWWRYLFLFPFFTLILRFGNLLLDFRMCYKLTFTKGFGPLLACFVELLNMMIASILLERVSVIDSIDMSRKPGCLSFRGANRVVYKFEVEFG
jgi:hypothetical protein